MSVVVAEEGNKRVGDMNAAEVEQCIFDIKSWFGRKVGEAIEGASSADIQRLEKTLDFSIPREVKAFFREVNGAIYFMDKKSLTTAEVADIAGDLDKNSQWKAGYFPLCGDASSLLIIDTMHGDAVFEWDEDDGKGDEVGSSFSAYLEQYRNTLLGGHCDFIKDIGVIESVAAKSKK